MKVTANVKNKKTSNVILEKEQEDMQMAPNSIFNFLFLMKKMKWKWDVCIGNDCGRLRKKWQFTKEFTISKEEAKHLMRKM